MKLRLLEVAEVELDEAVAWYADKGQAAVTLFLAEIATARSRILDHPFAWHPLGDQFRRYRLNRFPYGLIYVVDTDEIVILAVAHHSRRPDYWRDRLRNG